MRAPRAPEAESGERLPDNAVIPHSRPALGEEEMEAVRQVVASGTIAQGPRVEHFESAVASFVGGDEPIGLNGVAVSSGTAALYVALRALGIGASDEVLVPAFVCASVLQAVRTAGATPRFVDCDPATSNIDPADARRKVNRRTAAVIVAHLFGLPAQTEAFMELGPPVIEDCAQTLGARCGQKPVGTFGSLVTCSFYATKLLCAGEGGMVLSPDASLLERVRHLRDCDDPESSDWAFNFKMSDLHAAVGLVQLARLPELLARRAELAERYREAFAELPVRLPTEPHGRVHQYFRFVVSVQDRNAETLLRRCQAFGLSCRRPVGYLTAPVRADLTGLPGCHEAWRTACSVPLYPALTNEEACQVMRRFVAALDSGDE